MAIKFIMSITEYLKFHVVVCCDLEGAGALHCLNAQGQPTGMVLLCGHASEDGMIDAALYDLMIQYKDHPNVKIVCCFPQKVKLINAKDRLIGHMMKHVLGMWGEMTGTFVEPRNDYTYTLNVVSEAQATRLGFN